MKRILLLISISLLTLSALTAQEKNAELLNQRNQYFQHYKVFKDSMTIRTWLNMVELSKRLEDVVLLDNILLDSLLIGTPADVNLEARVKELSSLKDQLITSNARLNDSYTTISKQKSNLIFIIVVIALILLLLMISWIRNMLKYKHIEKFSGRSSEKILNLKQTHKEELDLLKVEIEKLKEDQILMENAASQMKKSYEILKSEQSDNDSSIGLNNDEGFDEMRKEMEAINEELSSILEDKQKIAEELKMANLENLKYQNANKTMEDELIKNQEATKSVEDELELILRKLKNE